MAEIDFGGVVERVIMRDEFPLEKAREVLKDETIAVVSISPVVLQTARGILAPVVGPRHTIREYLLQAENLRGLEVTDLVLCDLIAQRRVRARNLLPYRLVSPTCLKRLSTAMEAYQSVHRGLLQL